MESKNKRGRLLVEMSTGKLTIENTDSISSDPFISNAYNPTGYKKRKVKSVYLLRKEKEKSQTSLEKLIKKEKKIKPLLKNPKKNKVVRSSSLLNLNTTAVLKKVEVTGNNELFLSADKQIASSQISGTATFDSCLRRSLSDITLCEEDDIYGMEEHFQSADKQIASTDSRTAIYDSSLESSLSDVTFCEEDDIYGKEEYFQSSDKQITSTQISEKEISNSSLKYSSGAVTLCEDDNNIKITSNTLNFLNKKGSSFEVYYGEDSYHEQFCEVESCNDEVFASCHKCKILQCYHHFIHNTCIDSCVNHQKVIPVSIQTEKETPLAETKTQLVSEEKLDKLSEPEKNNLYLLSSDNDIHNNAIGFTTPEQTQLNQPIIIDAEYILDDQTGWLYEKRQEPTATTQQAEKEMNFILDDQTGQLIEQNRIMDKTNDDVNTLVLGNRKYNKDQRVKGQSYLKRKINKTDHSLSVIPKPKKTLKDKRCTHDATSLKTTRTFLCAAISDDQRECIFKYFWDLDSWDAKKAYLKNLVRTRPVIRRRKAFKETAKKAIGYDCYLPNEYNEMIKVCKSFLISTLDMNNETLSDWIKCLNNIEYIEPSVGGSESTTECKAAGKRLPKTDSVKEWLNLLPKVPSHYCRSSSNRTYVDSTFGSIAHMFRTYQMWCTEENKPEAQRKLFCAILKKEKISIFKPRKDQCDTCTAFREKNLSSEDFEMHQKMKQEAYTAKAEALSMCSSEVLVFSVDTQSVLLCPKLLVSEQYYKQKLQMHNYTIYCNNNKNVDLYVWHEGHGDVTSNEFTTCLLHFLETQANLGYKKMIMFSDGCGYQNRNKVLASALNEFAKDKGVEIEHRYLEKGHTMMEADSVHSTLEKLFKPPIFLPSDYLNLMAQARPSNPYNIHHLDYRFFKNFAKTCKLDSLRPGKKVGEPVVTNIRALLYKNGEIFYKLRHPEDWVKLPQRTLSIRSSLTNLYKQERKIEKTKYLSLQSLKKYMHKDNHNFYDNLQH